MKKNLIPILALLILAGCGNQTANSASGNDSDSVAVGELAASARNHNKKAAKATAEAAYNSYFNPSEEEQAEADGAEINIFGIAYMYKYLTPELCESIVMAYDKQNATDDLFLDYDIWINGQDWESPTLTNVNIIEYTGDKATAEVNFTDYGEKKKAYIVMQYDKEKDAWLICDFLDPIDKDSFAECLADYLEDSPEE